MLWFCDKDSRESAPKLLSSSAQSRVLLCFSQYQDNKELVVQQELEGHRMRTVDQRDVSYYMALCSAIKGGEKKEEMGDIEP